MLSLFVVVLIFNKVFLTSQHLPVQLISMNVFHSVTSADSTCTGPAHSGCSGELLSAQQAQIPGLKEQYFKGSKPYALTHQDSTPTLSPLPPVALGSFWVQERDPHRDFAMLLTHCWNS